MENFSTFSHSSVMKLDLEMVGNRIEVVRLYNDLTKADFAASCGLDASSYSKVIQGLKPLKAEHAFRIAEAWSVTMDYIYRGSLSGLSSEFIRFSNDVKNRNQE